MKLSTKGLYGTRALLDVALHNDGSRIPLRDIAKRQDISVQYLGHLVSPLVKAGVLRAVRGAGGGITMAKSPAEIKLSQVIQILEGSMAPVQCVDDPRACSRSDSCVTRDVWDEIKKAIGQVLESTTLQDLVERQKEMEKPPAPVYYI